MFIRTRPIRRMTQAELDGYLEKAADILRGNVDHSEFRGYVFALLFYKRISDVFEENVQSLVKRLGDEALARDVRMHEFVVPEGCLWDEVVRTEPRKLGTRLNETMLAIERVNKPKFDGILHNAGIDFNAQETLPRNKLIDLINHFSSRRLDHAHAPDDIFGNAYEYLIRSFASKAGKSSGEFYTPKEVGYLMAEMIEPAPGDHICDWAGGSGGLLLQCRSYVLRHHGKREADRLFFYLQESNLTTYNIARINMILHGVRGVQLRREDSLRQPQFVEGHTRRLRQFDREIMNPPFSLESWGYDDFARSDPYSRFGFGMPPRDNGGYAWMQHVKQALKPAGKGIIVMSQGILFRGQPAQTEEEDGRNQKADAEYSIRAGFVKDDLIECVVVLPAKIFYGNTVPGCLVVLNRRKAPERRGQILMVWAARHYQSDNPQNILRRADCMRVLVPWRAFGDLARCLELIAQHEQELIGDIERERAAALAEIHEAYDPLLEPLPALAAELAQLEAFDAERWLGQPGAGDPYLGDLLPLAQRGADEGLPAKQRAAAAKELRQQVRAAKSWVNARRKEVRRLVKELARLKEEADGKIAAANQHAEREIVQVQETAADLVRICSDPNEAQRYFTTVESTEIEENEFNLNLPRYVDTFEREEQIDIDLALAELARAESETEVQIQRLRKLLQPQ